MTHDTLQPGDYVTGLTESQYRELLIIESKGGKINDQWIEFAISKGGISYFAPLSTLTFMTQQLGEELPHSEFLRRAKNTFNTEKQ